MVMLSRSPGGSVVALKSEGWKWTLSVVTEKMESSVSASLINSVVSWAGMQRGRCLNSSVAGSNFTRLEAPAVAGGAEGGASGTSEPEEKKAVITVTRSDDQGGKGEPPLPRRPCPGIAP